MSVNVAADSVDGSNVPRDAATTAPLPAGSTLLLHKMPLMAQLRQRMSMDVLDPRAECNTLSYGADTYTMLTLVRACEYVMQTQQPAAVDDDDDDDRNGATHTSPRQQQRRRREAQLGNAATTTMTTLPLDLSAPFTNIVYAFQRPVEQRWQWQQQHEQDGSGGDGTTTAVAKRQRSDEHGDGDVGGCDGGHVTNDDVSATRRRRREAALLDAAMSLPVVSRLLEPTVGYLTRSCRANYAGIVAANTGSGSRDNNGDNSDTLPRKTRDDDDDDDNTDDDTDDDDDVSTEHWRALTTSSLSPTRTAAVLAWQSSASRALARRAAVRDNDDGDHTSRYVSNLAAFAAAPREVRAIRHAIHDSNRRKNNSSSSTRRGQHDGGSVVSTTTTAGEAAAMTTFSDAGGGGGECASASVAPVAASTATTAATASNTAALAATRMFALVQRSMLTAADTTATATAAAADTTTASTTNNSSSVTVLPASSSSPSTALTIARASAHADAAAVPLLSHGGSAELRRCVTAYLKRVAWIAQQRQHSHLVRSSDATATTPLPWLQAGEAARVQREMQHTRQQRQRYHRRRRRGNGDDDEDEGDGSDVDRDATTDVVIDDGDDVAQTS